MPNESQRASLTRAAEHYAQNVDQAAGYLQGRELWAEWIQSTFRLGVVADPLPGHEPYEGRLSIPYLTPAGVVKIRFRSLGESKVKYLDPPGAETRLYNVAALHQPGDTLLVCEGELDAVAASYAGYAAVGVPGAQAWQPHWGRLMQDYEHVIVPVDGDEAGQDFGEKVRRAVEHAEIRYMPDGHDVNSFIAEFGDSDFDALISA